ncbi:MAG: phosphatidylserine/phosphatidylglycerophosphate/cardiolipin synthase family protein [Rivularia sp. (in: cyanobacteria)]
MELWWIGGIIFGGIVAILLIFYFRGTFRQRIAYRFTNVPQPQDQRFPLALASLSNSVQTTGKCTDFWLEAASIFTARQQAINNAEYSIHFETFIITPGKRANDFAAAIAERAAAGVEVKLIVDHYGTKGLPQKYWRRLQAAGVDIKFFNSFNPRAPIDYLARTHRKLLIIDGKTALIGGAGISDFWDGQDDIKNTEPWYDFEMRFQGAVVAVLEGMFMQHWAYLQGIADLDTRIFNPQPADDSQILVTAGDDPSYRASSVKALFQTSIYAATKRLWISSPYFIPDDNLKQALIAAKKRGVEVRILTNGSKSDKKFVYYAACEQYRAFLSAGIEINEYQPSMLHAKALLVDDCWISTGSANFDSRSFFHNDELDVSTSQPELVKNIEHLFLLGFSRCKQMNIARWKKRPIWQSLVGRAVLFFQSQL